jgi:hypothetical protein
MSLLSFPVKLLTQIKGDRKENKSRVSPHVLIYPTVFHGFSRTDNYTRTSYAQSFYWLPTSRKLYYSLSTMVKPVLLLILG